MSFEDDMIEEGFSNEQDYLDFLCWKADSRIVYDTEEERQWELDRNKNEVLFRKNNNERLRQWKLKNEKRAKTWAYIWSRNKNIEKDKHHYAERYYLTDCGEDNRDTPLLFDNYLYYKIPTEGSLWTLWKHSAEAYGQWKESNQDLWNCWKKEKDAEGTKDFFLKFIHNSDITESFNLCRDYIINHNIPLRDNEEIRKDAVIKAWKENFVHNKTKEEILFCIWRECHSKEWSNWLMINYSRIRYLTMNKESPFLLSWQIFYHEIDEYSYYFQELHDYFSSEKEGTDDFMEDMAETESTLKTIVEEQVQDWWQFYVNDLSVKHQRAFDWHLDYLFNSINEGDETDSSFECFLRNMSREITTREGEIEWHDDYISLRQGVILTDSFCDDLRPRSLEEIEKISGRKPSVSIYGDINMELPEFTEEERIRYIREKQERQSLQIGFRQPCSADFHDYLSKNRDDLYFSLPYRSSFSFPYTTMLGVSSEDLVYYFLRDSFAAEMLGALNGGDTSWISFKNKYYSTPAEFEKNECSFSGFNRWCKIHHLPSLLDYIFKYWTEHEINHEQYLLFIWRRLWRGDWWIDYHYRDIDDFGIFLLWKENHSEEWNRWEKQYFDQYLLMYRYVDAFRGLVDEIDKESIAFLNQEGNPVKLLMKKDLERRYIDWLSDGYSSDELEENKDTFLNRDHPLFTEFMEMRYRSLWNESHTKEQHIVIGIDKDFYDYEHDNPLSYFYYYELFDKIFPVKTS